LTQEQDLLRQAQSFDTRALAEIYDVYSPKLYHYAMRFLSDADAAEDCVAETFSRLLNALRNGKGPRDYLQAYLFRTAHNFIADHYRRQPPIEELDDELPDSANIEETVGSNLNQQRVRAALRQLTEEQQQVIALKFLEGWDNEEIARALRKPVGAVKSLQHRAVARLQKILLDEDDHDQRQSTRPAFNRPAG
jgi:RNA polymerase sigma-70 factor (ECF subfamily)